MWPTMVVKCQRRQNAAKKARFSQNSENKFYVKNARENVWMFILPQKVKTTKRFFFFCLHFIILFLTSFSCIQRSSDFSSFPLTESGRMCAHLAVRHSGFVFRWDYRFADYGFILLEYSWLLARNKINNKIVVFIVLFMWSDIFTLIFNLLRVMPTVKTDPHLVSTLVSCNRRH